MQCDALYSVCVCVCVILPPFIPAPKGDWVFWRWGYKNDRIDQTLFQERPAGVRRFGKALQGLRGVVCQERN